MSVTVIVTALSVTVIVAVVAAVSETVIVLLWWQLCLLLSLWLCLSECLRDVGSV